MGRGRSKAGASTSGSSAKSTAKAATAKPKAAAKTQAQAQPQAKANSNQPWWKNGANTPSGLDYDSYQKMSMNQKLRVTHDIINDKSIKVPKHLDDSDTTKVLYALGKADKPDVVTDTQLSKMKGQLLYRTVNGDSHISGREITKEIRTGDYTQLSGKGGSAYGRALYFAKTVSGSAAYAGGSDSVMIRARIKPTAKIADYKTVVQGAANTAAFSHNNTDNLALWAIANGYDGWKALNGYHMIVNRKALVISDRDKDVTWQTKTW